MPTFYYQLGDGGSLDAFGTIDAPNLHVAYDRAKARNYCGKVAMLSEQTYRKRVESFKAWSRKRGKKN